MQAMKFHNISQYIRQIQIIPMFTPFHSTKTIHSISVFAFNPNFRVVIYIVFLIKCNNDFRMNLSKMGLDILMIILSNFNQGLCIQCDQMTHKWK